MASGNGDDLQLPTVITQGITQYDDTVSTAHVHKSLLIYNYKITNYFNGEVIVS